MRRGAADCGEYCEGSDPKATAVKREVEEDWRPLKWGAGRVKLRLIPDVQEIIPFLFNGV
jgi:hypothetical protein